MTSLNEYIIQTVGQANDVELLLDFIKCEVYFSILSANADLHDGGLHSVAQNNGFRVCTAILNIGPVAIFHASRDDKRLHKKFGGVSLGAAMEIAYRSPEMNGILILSDCDAWIVADKRALKHIVDKIRGSDIG